MSLPPIKEVFDALAIKDGLDFDTGTGDIEEIKRMGVLGVNRAKEDFRWTSLRKLSKRTVGPRAVYDVVGAGDTVTAYLAAMLASGATALEAAIIANFAAGVEVGKLGAATVTTKEVLAAFDAHGPPR